MCFYLIQKHVVLLNSSFNLKSNCNLAFHNPRRYIIPQGNFQRGFGFVATLTTMGPHLNTVVAHTTVGTPWGSVELTGCTPLHPHCNTTNIHIFVQWGSEIIFSILIFMCCRKKKIFFVNTVQLCIQIH